MKLLRKKDSAVMKINTNFLFILFAFCTCCTSAWPVATSAFRQNSEINSNHIPYDTYNVPPESEYQRSYRFGQWEKAEPSYYDSVDDYWMNQPDSADTYSNFVDMYDAPTWGKIVREKPESELEKLKFEERDREMEERELNGLEDLFRYYASNYKQEKRGNPSKNRTGHNHGKETTASIKTETTTVLPKTMNSKPGQKEFPLLRPATKTKNTDRDGITDQIKLVAQRSAAAEKPSAYDTLRQYLSLEDALKQEAEKRRSAADHLKKRTPAEKGIVTDIESLSGQLSNLKKSIA